MHKSVATHYTFILLLYKNVSELTRSSLNKTEQKFSELPMVNCGGWHPNAHKSLEWSNLVPGVSDGGGLFI